MIGGQMRCGARTHLQCEKLLAQTRNLAALLVALVGGRARLLELLLQPRLLEALLLERRVQLRHLREKPLVVVAQGVEARL